MLKMLAVALNYPQGTEENQLGTVLVKLFNDFKVVRMNPDEEKPKGQLELCQPTTYSEVVQDIQKHWDATGTFLELSGPRVKLQRVVRQMCFFETDRKFDKVLLEGRQGIIDFPWAVQIVLIQRPATGKDLDLEWIKKADIMVVDGSEEESREFIAQVKKIRPDVRVFREKVSEGLSKELQDSLEDVWAAYLEKRKKIKMMLAEKLPEQVITCEQAHRMAAQLRVSLFLFGNVCDECGYSITTCGLGCF